MGRKILSIFFCWLAFILPAQKLIFEEIPDKIFEPPVFGLKGRHYVHFFYEGAIPLGKTESDTLRLRNWHSGCWNFGVRYKLKILKKVCFIGELSYGFQSYFIRQDGNRFPDTLEHKKEKINISQARGALALRFIFSKRKKYFGKYIDIGATAAWNFTGAHYTKNVYKFPDAPYSSQVLRLRERDPAWLAATALDAWAALGLEKLQFRLYYRLTDVFRSYKGKVPGELPAVRIGINFAVTGS